MYRVLYLFGFPLCLPLMPLILIWASFVQISGGVTIYDTHEHSRYRDQERELLDEAVYRVCCYFAMRFISSMDVDVLV
ncbi:hypothetical protein GGR52DRAFT_379634 [Hypoxylon sp. FL1284]|nr:hypothetical protein GGR52DRAFT_379634 [Hypoxylon sp. FL1284]